jgi:hypothetical protein
MIAVQDLSKLRHYVLRLCLENGNPRPNFDLECDLDAAAQCVRPGVHIHSN